MKLLLFIIAIVILSVATSFLPKREKPPTDYTITLYHVKARDVPVITNIILLSDKLQPDDRVRYSHQINDQVTFQQQAVPH